MNIEDYGWSLLSYDFKESLGPLGDEMTAEYALELEGFYLKAPCLEYGIFCHITEKAHGFISISIDSGFGNKEYDEEFFFHNYDENILPALISLLTAYLKEEQEKTAELIKLEQAKTTKIDQVLNSIERDFK